MSQIHDEELPVLLDLALREVQSSMAHADALDAKAGIVLGFAAVLLVVADSPNLATQIGQLFAAMTALFAVLAFIPRMYGRPNLEWWHRRLLKDGGDARRRLADTAIRISAHNHVQCRAKQEWLTAAIGSMALAVAVFTVGAILEMGETL